jgi:hypothetical protein
MKRIIFTLMLAAGPASLPAFAQDSAETPETGTGRDDVAELSPAVRTSPARAGLSPPAVDRSAAPSTSAASAPRSRPDVIDRLDLGTTSITGNQELPKVLYIVPWKRSDLGDLIGRPVNTLLDEVLAPVDPEVFERHLSYYETLHGKSQEE